MKTIKKSTNLSISRTQHNKIHSGTCTMTFLINTTENKSHNQITCLRTFFEKDNTPPKSQ